LNLGLFCWKSTTRHEKSSGLRIKFDFLLKSEGFLNSMGARLSLNNSRSEPSEVLRSELCRRQRLSSSFCEENSRLISSLPDEISMQILARIPRINYLNLKLVSRAWKAAILSVELYNVRKELGTTEEWLYILTKVENDKLLWYALDPLSRRWQRLPPMPNFAFED